MLGRVDILNHAKSAVDGTACSLSEMRKRLQTAAAIRQQQLVVDEAMHGLSHRHEILAKLYEEMLDVPDSELPTQWQRFLVCYNDHLEAVRDAKYHLVREV